MSKARRGFPLGFHLGFAKMGQYYFILISRFSYLNININFNFLLEKLYLKSLEIFDPNIEVTIYYNKLSSRKNHGKSRIHEIENNVNLIIYSNGVL